jgi:hypothetical protein
MSHVINNKSYCNLQKLSAADRLKQSSQLRAKYPGQCPVVLCYDTAVFGSDMTDRMITRHDYTTNHFMMVVKRKLADYANEQKQRGVDIRLKPEEALLYFVQPESNSKRAELLPSNALFSQIDASHRHADGFLYIRMTKEATFGGTSQQPLL